MTAVKVAPKGVAEVCVRKRVKAYKAKEAGAHVIQQAARKEEVKSKLERIEKMLGEFEEEVFMQGVVGVRVQEGPNMGPGEEELMSEERINVLDNDIDSLLDQLQKLIPALLHSQEISLKQSYKFEKQMRLLQGRYIDVGSFGNDL